MVKAQSVEKTNNAPNRNLIDFSLAVRGRFGGPKFEYIKILFV